MMERLSTCLLVCSLATVPLVAAASQTTEGEVTAVASLDLERYAGQWYEIARLPNRFQRDCASDVTATYVLRDDGRIDVINSCRKADGESMGATGIARFASEDEPKSKLKVRFAPSFMSFLPFVWADYWVIDLAADYSYAVVGHPNRNYLWVLSRTPTMDDRLYEEITERFVAQGYDATRVVRTKQSPRD